MKLELGDSMKFSPQSIEEEYIANLVVETRKRTESTANIIQNINYL